MKNDGRALDAQLLGGLGLLLHLLRVLARIQALVELGRLQAEVLGESLQLVLGERALVLAVLALEQLVVILPELALVARALAGFRGPLGFFAQEGHVHVTESNITRLDVLFLDLATRASGPTAAERSLEVADLR